MRSTNWKANIQKEASEMNGEQGIAQTVRENCFFPLESRKTKIIAKKQDCLKLENINIGRFIIGSVS